MATNGNVELKLEQRFRECLRELGMLPEGYQPEVHLHRGSRKKRSSDKFEGSWDPDTDSIRVAFSPMEEEIAAEKVAASPGGANPKPAEDRLVDTLRALERAEGRPGYEFVSLKWFRDTALLYDGFAWAAANFARDDVLREAIDRRWILTSKVANPRPPHFPVTAIRLNRQMPEVIAALGGRSGNLPGFRPVPIRGETLSATVLRDRR